MKTDRNDLTLSLVVFLSGQPEAMDRFFALSGIDPAQLRNRLSDHAFQDGLLDYVVSNEPLLLAFCEDTGENPARIARLAQGSTMHDDWS